MPTTSWWQVVELRNDQLSPQCVDNLPSLHQTTCSFLGAEFGTHPALILTARARTSSQNANAKEIPLPERVVTEIPGAQVAQPGVVSADLSDEEQVQGALFVRPQTLWNQQDARNQPSLDSGRPGTRRARLNHPLCSPNQFIELVLQNLTSSPWRPRIKLGGRTRPITRPRDRSKPDRPSVAALSNCCSPSRVKRLEQHHETPGK
jgi:hypothetical protein